MSLRLTVRTLRPATVSQGCSSHYRIIRHESASSTPNRAEAARARASADPMSFKNEAIPFPFVRWVNPETNVLEPKIRLAELLESTDLDESYVQLVTTQTSDGEVPIVKTVNKHAAAEKEREQKRKKKEQRKAQAGRESKEIQLSWGVEKGDLTHKLSKCIEELEKRNRVNVVFVKKKKSPMPRKEEQTAKLQAVWDAVKHIAVEREPRVMHDLTAVLYLQGTGKTKE